MALKYDITEGWQKLVWSIRFGIQNFKICWRKGKKLTTKNYRTKAKLYKANNWRCRMNKESKMENYTKQSKMIK